MSELWTHPLVLVPCLSLLAMALTTLAMQQIVRSLANSIGLLHEQRHSQEQQASAELQQAAQTALSGTALADSMYRSQADDSPEDSYAGVPLVRRGPQPHWIPPAWRDNQLARQQLMQQKQALAEQEARLMQAFPQPPTGYFPSLGVPIMRTSGDKQSRVA